MGWHPCCCGCVYLEEDFGSEPPAPWSYTPGHWSVGSGRITAVTADSLLYFYDGPGLTLHVGVTVYLPSVGSYVKLHYGGNTVTFERVSGATDNCVASIDGVTIGTATKTLVSDQASFALFLFRRNQHPYFYDLFTTEPDADLVGFVDTVDDLLLPGIPVQIYPTEYAGVGYPAGKIDVSSAPATWAFSASVGAGVAYAKAIYANSRCTRLEHTCGTPCWENGAPNSGTLTVAGLSDTGLDCNITWFNRSYVMDRGTLPCYYAGEFERPDGDGCLSPQYVVASAELTLDDYDNDLWRVDARVIGITSVTGEWYATGITRSQICGGSTIALSPVSGSAAGRTVSITFTP